MAAPHLPAVVMDGPLDCEPLSPSTLKCFIPATGRGTTRLLFFLVDYFVCVELFFFSFFLKLFPHSFIFIDCLWGLHYLLCQSLRYSEARLTEACDRPCNTEKFANSEAVTICVTIDLPSLQSHRSSKVHW